MNGQKRILFLILIMIAIAVGVGGITLYSLYRTAIDEERLRLTETAQSQARLIEAIARFDARYSDRDIPGGPFAATIGQIVEAHEHFEGFGETGEFTLAKREGDQIVFLLRHRHSVLEKPRPIPFTSDLAEPMRRALRGESGTIVGLDYRGVDVLAAHEPVAVLDLGIVAKIDLAEIRAPFIQAGLFAAGGAFVLITLGMIFFLQIGNPLVRRLEENERKYRTLFASATEGIFLISDVVKECNELVCRILACERRDIIGHTLPEFLPATQPDGQDSAQAVRERLAAASSDIPQSFYWRLRCKDGSRVDADVSMKAIRVAGRKMVLASFHDVTERVGAQAALQAQQAFTETALNAQIDTFFVFDPQTGEPIRWNKVFCDVSGYSDEKIRSMKAPDDFYGGEDLQRAAEVVETLMREGRATIELSLITSDGRAIPYEYVATIINDKEGNPQYICSIGRDISKRKEAEQRQELTAAVLSKLNQPLGKPDIIRELLLTIKKSSGFEAVGIRLREGDDYPYFESAGFPPTFLEAERFLCATDTDGKLVRDACGKPQLECMCGNVIRGRTDPSLPFYTDGASFWTNSTTELLNSTTEEDRQSRTRNRCHGEGYESVALIPLRSHDEIVGLLQLNDCRNNMFTPDMIKFYEGIGASIGIALARRKAEEALRKERDRAQKYLDVAGVIMVVINSDETVGLINNRGCEILGYPEREIIGKNWFDEFLPARTCEEVRTAFTRLMAGKIRSDEHFENPVLTKGGRERIIAWHNAVLIDDTGRVTSSLSSGEDITERKQAEEEIKRMNQALTLRAAELAEANREMEAFSYSASHDLRAPLRSIDGFSQALLEDYADQLDDSGKDYLRRVRTSSQHMAQLIDDLLKLSHVTRSEIHREEIDLSETAHKIGARFQQAEPQRQVEFRIAEELTVKGDRQLLSIALENLMANAWKFTAKKGAATIDVGLLRQNDESVYFIRDNGAGFDMNYASKLFVPFQRLHTPSEFRGTGIGLALVQRIINRHGGRIWAEGRVGEGATFYFTL